MKLLSTISRAAKNLTTWVDHLIHNMEDVSQITLIIICNNKVELIELCVAIIAV